MANTLSLELGKADFGPLISRTRGENICVLQSAVVIGHGSWRRQTHDRLSEEQGLLFLEVRRGRCRYHKEQDGTKAEHSSQPCVGWVRQGRVGTVLGGHREGFGQ